MRIIHSLFEDKKRFSQIERSIEGINTRMLSKELKKLEHYGIITRKAFTTIPPIVEYSLTSKGLSLLPIIIELHRWGQENYQNVPVVAPYGEAT
ncbi:MAG: helix-turn-helix transcriptional regulator [Bacteroidetes Order II. Incertae sedis bacterium]|nr:helix-turn-helix transcriptional regulator [Bacteroidetes Order II. bacterium]